MGSVGTFHVAMTVNGQRVEADVDPERRLIDVLRLNLGLTGTKESCGIGVCGTCSVLIDDRLMTACLVLAPTAHGRRVTTIEGLAEASGLAALQKAFLRHGGLQCGFCTPGQLMAASALLAEIPDPTEDEVREWLSGNLCRCTGYRSIVDSVLAAAEEGRIAGPVADESDGGTA